MVTGADTVDLRRAKAYRVFALLAGIDALLAVSIASILPLQRLFPGLEAVSYLTIGLLTPLLHSSVPVRRMRDTALSRRRVSLSAMAIEDRVLELIESKLALVRYERLVAFVESLRQSGWDSHALLIQMGQYLDAAADVPAEVRLQAMQAAEYARTWSDKEQSLALITALMVDIAPKTLDQLMMRSHPEGPQRKRVLEQPPTRSSGTSTLFGRWRGHTVWGPTPPHQKVGDYLRGAARVLDFRNGGLGTASGTAFERLSLDAEMVARHTRSALEYLIANASLKEKGLHLDWPPFVLSRDVLVQHELAGLRPNYGS